MKAQEYILILLMVLIFGMLLYLVINLKSEGFKAISNPFTYSIDKLSDYFGEEVYCYCNLGIKLNRTAITKEERSYGRI